MIQSVHNNYLVPSIPEAKGNKTSFLYDFCVRVDSKAFIGVSYFSIFAPLMALHKSKDNEAISTFL